MISSQARSIGSSSSYHKSSRSHSHTHYHHQHQQRKSTITSLKNRKTSLSADYSNIITSDNATESTMGNLEVIQQPDNSSFARKLSRSIANTLINVVKRMNQDDGKCFLFISFLPVKFFISSLLNKNKNKNKKRNK